MSPGRATYQEEMWERITFGNQRIKKKAKTVKECSETKVANTLPGLMIELSTYRQDHLGSAGPRSTKVFFFGRRHDEWLKTEHGPESMVITLADPPPINYRIRMTVCRMYDRMTQYQHSSL